MKSDNKTVIWLLLRIVFGAILIFSGVLKFIDLNSFGEAILKFKILEHSLIPFVKVLIPSIEIILGSLLVLNIKTAEAAQAATVLLAFFTALLIAKIFEGEKISCNCFGSLTSGYIDWTTVLRNLILMSASIAIGTYYTLHFPIKTKSLNSSGFFDRLSEKEWYIILKKNLFITLFFFLAIQVIILSLQNAGLKDSISLLLTNNETAQPGETAAQIEGVDLNGRKTTLKFDEGKYSLLFIFSSKCEPCKINFPNWVTLTGLLKNNDIDIIGIGVNTLEEIEKYSAEHKPNFKILAEVSTQFKSDYKAYTTPQSIVIGKDGKIIKAYPGILNSVNTQKLLNDLSIKLN